MAKLGFFWCSKIDIFACTIRKSWPWFDWYLEASKTGNDRLAYSQKINKKLLKTIRTKKAASTDFARLQVYWNWEVTFGIYAIWLLILGHHFTIFWGHFVTWLLISGHLFAFCFIWSVTPGWWSSGWVWFVGLVWVHRHLVQTVWANMWIAHSKVPHPTWEPLGKMF